MGQENYPFSWITFAPSFAPDTTTITDTSTIMGSNIREGDGPIERHVLQKVGSYGYQLNRIIDVLSILLAHATANGTLPAEWKPASGTEAQVAIPTGDMARRSIQDFYEMAAKAAKASEESRGEATERAADHWIERLNRLHDSDNESDRKLYQSIKRKIENGLQE